jgi:uncharacterized membrane protein YhaH (DUF805 family)
VVILIWIYVAAWAENSWVQTVLVTAFWLQTIRRLHDLGRTGWWVAAIYLGAMSLALLPTTYPGVAMAYWAPILFPAVALFLIAAWPGEAGENRFGARGRTPPPDQPSRIPDRSSH